MCGGVRANTRCGGAYGERTSLADRLAIAHPQLMLETTKATRALAGSFDPSCDAHLPRGSSHARWRGLATNVTTHVQRSVALAVRRTAAKVAASVVDAVKTEGVPQQSTQQAAVACKAAAYSATVSCLERGSDDLVGALCNPLNRLPERVRAIAVAQMAAAQGHAQPARPEGAASLFPVGSADKLAAGWWRYIPILISALRLGVDKPYSIVPGAAARLVRHETMKLAMTHTLVKRVLPGSAALIADFKERSAAAFAHRIRGHPVGTVHSSVGAGFTTDVKGCAFTVSRGATPVEAEATDVAASTRRPNGYLARPRVAGSPLTQLQKQGFPVAAVRSTATVSIEPGEAALLTGLSSGVQVTASVDRPLVRRQRLARAQIVALDALTRASLVIGGVVDRAAALTAAEDGVARAPADSAKGEVPPAPKAPLERKAPPKAAAAATKTARTVAAPGEGAGNGAGGTDAGDARDGTRADCDGPLAVAVGGGEPASARNEHSFSDRSVRGTVAAVRRGARRSLQAAVRELIRATHRGRWTVPRHKAIEVALGCVSKAARRRLGRLTGFFEPEAGSKAARMQPPTAAPYAAALRELQEEVTKTTTAAVGRKRPPSAGGTYTLSRGRYHEQAGSGMIKRAAAEHRAAAIASTATKKAPPAGTATSVSLESLAAHDSIRSAVTATVLAACRQWLHAFR